MADDDSGNVSKADDNIVLRRIEGLLMAEMNLHGIPYNTQLTFKSDTNSTARRIEYLLNNYDF